MEEQAQVIKEIEIMNNYLVAAREIIEKHDLQKYVDVLLDYWEQNPTTLGHGFAHVIKVAVESYDLGLDNNYPNPEELFVGGLYHDIYRPAEGSDGDEDQTKGAGITKELFDKNGFSAEVTDKVYAMIMSHDDWRGQKDVPLYDLLISVGDKISHGPDLAYHYVWASNKTLISQGQPPKYTNHIVCLYGFIKYQQRAWEIFIKHPVKGTERAIDSYLKIYSVVTDNYQSDPKGERFVEYVESQAQHCREDETESLKFFGADEAKIEKIMKNFY